MAIRPGGILDALANLDQKTVSHFRREVLQLASDTEDNRNALARISYCLAKDDFGRERIGLTAGKPPILVADVLWELEDILQGRVLPGHPGLSPEDIGAVLRLSVLVFSLLNPRGRETPVTRRAKRPQRRKPAKSVGRKTRAAKGAKK